MLFHKIKGYIEIFINGEKLEEKDCMWGSNVEVPLKQGLSGKVTVTVLIKCNNKNYIDAGICQPVVLRKNSKGTLLT